MAEGETTERPGRGSASDRLTPRETQLLYALSAGRCAKCRRGVVLESEASGKVFNIGKRAHIVGRSEDGPRGDATVALEERGDLSNHVLLCGACHDEIDQDEEAWPVERLGALRASHVAWIDERLSDPSESPDYQLYGGLVQAACELVGLDSWILWTEAMFDLHRSWRPQQIEDVAEFTRRLGATDWPGSLPELECALKRLGHCLSAAAGTFSDHAEARSHDLHVPRWYATNGWNPNYHRDAEVYEQWLRDYEALLVEATRAADWVRTTWREAGHPLFMLSERPQVVTSNNSDGRLHFITFEYSPEQRQRLLEAADVRAIPPLPAFEPDIDNGGLGRLIRDILEDAGGRPPADDLVAHLEKVLRTTDGVLDTAALFEGAPGRRPDVDIRRRVSADLLRHGVLERNPGGRGFVVVDLKPDR